MGKGEEYLAKKRNKAIRKRLKNTVDFTHGVQAAKRRRKAGRRRVCEGMCYTLPTPDDPFNDLYLKRLEKGKTSKLQKNDEEHDLEGSKDKVNSGSEINRLHNHKEKRQKTFGGDNDKNVLLKKILEKSMHMKTIPGSVRHITGSRAQDSNEESGNQTLKRRQIGVLPSKATIDRPINVDTVELYENPRGLKTGKVLWRPDIERCLKKGEVWVAEGSDAFESSLCAALNVGLLANSTGTNFDAKGSGVEKMKRMIGSTWDWKFWEACGAGLDVIATGTATRLSCQADYVLAAVVHISAKRFQNTMCQNPIVLFILQSQEQTLQVRNICKHFKQALRIHSVCLHAGTSLQHQVEGLSSNLPEILVATPDRLCELLAVKAVSISNVSFMVIDGLDNLIRSGFGELLQQINLSVDANVQTAVLSDSISHIASIICRQVLKDPISRVISNPSLVEDSACITQDVSVIVSEERRLQKLAKILSQHFEKRQDGATLIGTLVLFRQPEIFSSLKAALQDKGYTVGHVAEHVGSESNSTVLEQFRKGQLEVLLSSQDFMGQIDIGALRTVINYEFPSTMHLYRQILTGMARHTAKGMLHSFCSGAVAPLAAELMEVLVQCLQPIPPSLRMLAEAATVIAQKPVYLS